MSISGLVVTLSDDSSAQAALSMLASDPRITLGERFGRRIALVADTQSVQSDRDLWDELRENPGITNVDVTFVHLDAESVESKKPGRIEPLEGQHAHR